jgi:hypothetical protein
MPVPESNHRIPYEAIGHAGNVQGCQAPFLASSARRARLHEDWHPPTPNASGRLSERSRSKTMSDTTGSS